MGQRDRIDRRSDVYSLGATIYFMVTRHAPFEAEGAMETLMKVVKEEVAAPRRINPAVSPALEAILLKCLERDSARRYPTVADLAADLRRLSAGETVLARTPRRRWVPRFLRQNPVISSSLSVAALAIAAAIYFTGSAPDPAETARREWWDQFRSARADFGPGESPKAALGDLLARAPRALGPDTRELLQWFKDQALLGESPIAALENEDRGRWPGLTERARRLAQWARTMQSFLKELPGEFAGPGESFGKLAGRAERIASFPGMITLRIHVFPFASLRSLKAGDRWFIRDGKLEDPGFGALVGTNLGSPLVVQQFEINDYDLELAHPELGLRKVSLRREQMAHGGNYRLEGDMAAEGRLQLSREP
jgi:hypothetical protein